jgi:hypothetical protein
MGKDVERTGRNLSVIPAFARKEGRSGTTDENMEIQ